MQRLVGNIAVRSLLTAREDMLPAAAQRQGPTLSAAPLPSFFAGGQAETILRSATDRHDLASPRFRGDPLLEACRDDRARLTMGDSGPAVEKIQTALVELGYDLGPMGADGQYGERTWTAVKRFKSVEQLGWTQFGDVGPATMARLDALFASTSPAPPTGSDVAPEGLDTDAGVCLSDEEIESHVAFRPASSSGALASERQSARQACEGGPHPDNAASVAKFKQLVNAKEPAAAAQPTPNVSNWGQFFWVGQVDSAVGRETSRLLGADDQAKRWAEKADALRLSIFRREEPTVRSELAELDRLAARTNSPEKASMQRLLLPLSPQQAARAEAELWAAFNQRVDGGIPHEHVERYRSLRALHALYAHESTGCGVHAARVADRLHRKGGIVRPAPHRRAFGLTLASGRGIRDRRPMEFPASTFEPAASAAVTAGSPMMLGDHIFQQGAAGAAAAMRVALDCGQLVHCRVLSGIGYGTHGLGPPDEKAKPLVIGAPPEEHSLLVIGHEGDTFVFHDPDAAVSHSPENGFGLLTYDPIDDRLSTAQSPGDMVVDGQGKHGRGDKRYQVIAISTI